VVFLHRVAPGAADRSYGVHVARLAGVPEPVTRRAAAILRDLERSRSGQLGQNGTAGAEPAASTTPISGANSTALRRLADLDPLRMSPLEALTELTALVELIREREPT
jgi:DNA mismatch repair protein MutS